MPDEPYDASDSPLSASRRTFLKGVGAAGLAATVTPLASAETAFREAVDAPGATPEAPIPDAPLREQTARVASGRATKVAISLKVNGKERRVSIDPRASLLDALREDLHLTGTKKGCDHGQCGACTVHINGRRANACLSLALTNQGDEITTIEGLGTPENLHPMQAAFVEHDGYQCGYCTSGQIMSAVAMTKEPWGPEDAQVKEAMSGNICRCGAYANIVDAIQQVRKEGK
ncbi:2Fe-2S iron-sulfur cluster binding domain-containing protein [bacterium]|nr:MAG: 2Fe-2S iron-sulfur cluster binding domain-containing protein [bacterium]